MKKLIAVFLGMMMILGAAGCANTTVENRSADTENVEIPNPFVDFVSMEEAEKFAGFPISLPSTIDGYPTRVIQAVQNEMIQVLFFDKETADEGAQVIMIRKAIGSADISGDYNDYQEVNTVTVDDKEITVKGNDGKIHVAIWNSGDHSYSITSDTGVSIDTVSDWIRSVQ